MGQEGANRPGLKELLCMGPTNRYPTLDTCSAAEGELELTQ
jgi:hypothetical protein